MNNFTIHSSVNRHLGCFYFLATVNRAETNMDEQVISVVGYKVLWAYAQDWDS